MTIIDILRASGDLSEKSVDFAASSLYSFAPCETPGQPFGEEATLPWRGLPPSECERYRKIARALVTALQPDVVLYGEVGEIDVTRQLAVIRTGDMAAKLSAGYRLSGLPASHLKALAASLFEPVEIVIRARKAG